jgi:hypothetical protein
MPFQLIIRHSCFHSTLYSTVPNLFIPPLEGPIKQFFICRGTPTYETENKIKARSVARVDYSSTANCRTKILAIFQGIFRIFHGTYKFVCIYLISRILAQPLTMLCGILVGKHCYRVWNTDNVVQQRAKVNHSISISAFQVNAFRRVFST